MQVKRYESNVGLDAVREAFTGQYHYGCNRSMVITNNYFTPDAKRLADSTHCILVDRETLKKWIQEFQEETQELQVLASRTVHLAPQARDGGEKRPFLADNTNYAVSLSAICILILILAYFAGYSIWKSNHPAPPTHQQTTTQVQSTPEQPAALQTALSAPTGLEYSIAPDSNLPNTYYLTLTWNAVPGAQSYWVYSSASWYDNGQFKRWDNVRGTSLTSPPTE